MFNIFRATLEVASAEIGSRRNSWFTRQPNKQSSQLSRHDNIVPQKPQLELTPIVARCSASLNTYNHCLCLSWMLHIGKQSTLKQIQLKFCWLWVATAHSFLWHSPSTTLVFHTNFNLILGLMTKRIQLSHTEDFNAVFEWHEIPHKSRSLFPFYSLNPTLKTPWSENSLKMFNPLDFFSSGFVIKAMKGLLHARTLWVILTPHNGYRTAGATFNFTKPHFF